MDLFHAFCSVFRSESKREPEYEEEEEEILGSDDDEQEDPEDYQKGRHSTVRKVGVKHSIE